MIFFLARLFIKDYKQVESPYVRQGYGMLCGAFGIAFNIFLVIFKMLAGLISGSIAVFSDAINNLSDVVSSVVTLVFFKLSGADADEEHPFGHGRLEYIAGLIVSLLIIIMAVELERTSVAKIFKPEGIVFSQVVTLILVVSMGVKLFMFISYLRVAVAINSSTIRSTAMDSLSDVLSTGIVLASLIVYRFTGMNIDGVAGALVGIFILKTGIDSARDTINPLLGESPGREFIDDIKALVMTHGSILGVHDIVVHNYGPNRIMMSLHVEVPADKTIIEIHDLIDEIEKELRQKYHCVAVIHMDPIDEKDTETILAKECLEKTLKEMDRSITFHDFRIVRKEGKDPLIEFDMEIPYEFYLEDSIVVSRVESRLQEINPKYCFDIMVDKRQK